MMIMYLHTSPALRRPASCNMKKTTGKWQVVQGKCSPYMVTGKQVFCQVQRRIVADERTKGYHNNMPMQGVIWNIVGVFSTKHLPPPPRPHYAQDQNDTLGPSLPENNNRYSSPDNKQVGRIAGVACVLMIIIMDPTKNNL